MVFGDIPLCEVYFFTLPTRTGEDTDNTDTDCKEEREEGEEGVSSLLLTLPPSSVRVLLLGVCAEAGTKTGGTQRGHNSPSERVLLT